MTRPAHRLLATAAVLAVSLAATPARADHDRRDDLRERRLAPAARVHWPRPPGIVVQAPAVAMAFPYRPARWSVPQARAELRQEYRQLDLARDRFYATWDGHPWDRDRFEAWYAARRSTLDQRWAELDRWRARDRW